MKNLVTLLDTNIPIIQAPMAGVQDSALAIAVSNTGALGSLPCAMLSQEVLINELNNIKEQTQKPVNLNFFCHTMPELKTEQQALWHKELAPYFAEFEIDPNSIQTAATRLPFSQDHIDILNEFRPKVISFHFGLPAANLLEQLKAWGTTILSSATTVEEALHLQNNGADAIIAQGIEAGGHRGIFLTTDLSTQLGTFALLPQIVEAVNIPVIAAGGIASANAVKAAINLGAAGVQVGTSYLLCPEAKTTRLHRQALLSPEAKHTELTNIFTGRPARGIVNRAIKELGAINPLALSFPYASIAMSALRQAAEEKDMTDFSPLWAGENTTGCSLIPAAELTKQLAKGL